MEDARSHPKRRLPEVEVTNIRRSNERIEFDVSRTGVPVIVKTSYYPNWEVRRADGPWRATPNFMVVVPTERHVVVTYGTTTIEWVGRLLTVLGVVGLVLLVLWGPGAEARRNSSSRRSGRRVRFSVPPRTGAVRTRGLDVADSLDAIFKAYDVRGVYPDEIDESVARRIGNAFVAFTGAAVLVGRDARPSSEPLSAAFVEGATIAGADVVDLGFASTDLCYFAAGTLDAPAAPCSRPATTRPSTTG